jgi:hypothetical protein
MTGTLGKSPSSVRAGGQCLLDVRTTFRGENYASVQQFASIFFDWKKMISW